MLLPSYLPLTVTIRPLFVFSFECGLGTATECPIDVHVVSESARGHASLRSVVNLQIPLVKIHSNCLKYTIISGL